MPLVLRIELREAVSNTVVQTVSSPMFNLNIINACLTAANSLVADSNINPPALIGVNPFVQTMFTINVAYTITVMQDLPVCHYTCVLVDNAPSQFISASIPDPNQNIIALDFDLTGWQG